LDYLIPDAQHGFRKEKSCDDCLAILNLEIYGSFIRGECIGAIFLNIKSAYDNIYIPIVLNIINDLKIPIGYKVFLRGLDIRTIDIFETGRYQGTRSLFKDVPPRICPKVVIIQYICERYLKKYSV